MENKTQDTADQVHEKEEGKKSQMKLGYIDQNRISREQV